MSYVISKSGNITYFVNTVDNVIKNVYAIGPQPYSIAQINTSNICLFFSQPVGPAGQNQIPLVVTDISSIGGQQPESNIDDLIAQIADEMPISEQGVQPGTNISEFTNDVPYVTPTSTNTLTNKTLTAPKFADGGFIADANGNELIVMDTVASAVNEVTVSNAATTAAPKIAASGETNVALLLTGKGTGNVRVGDAADNTKLAEFALVGATAATKTTLAMSQTADRVITYPYATTTLVGTDTTNTLTNKTLTSPVINVGSDATGDLYYRNAGGLYTRLGIGNEGDVLTVVSGVPAWVAP